MTTNKQPGRTYYSFDRIGMKENFVEWNRGHEPSISLPVQMGHEYEVFDKVEELLSGGREVVTNTVPSPKLLKNPADYVMVKKSDLKEIRRLAMEEKPHGYIAQGDDHRLDGDFLTICRDKLGAIKWRLSEFFHPNLGVGEDLQKDLLGDLHFNAVKEAAEWKKRAMAAEAKLSEYVEKPPKISERDSVSVGSWS